MEKAEEKYLTEKKIYSTLMDMFAEEMRQEELEKDECYGCAYGKCGWMRRYLLQKIESIGGWSE